MALPRDNNELGARLETAYGYFKKQDEMSLVDCLWPRAIDWSLEERWVKYALHVDPAARNRNDVMHGGLIATVFDNAMGVLSGCFANCLTPTITLNTNFLRPVPLDSDLVLLAHITFLGRTMIHAEASAWQRDLPEKPLATATGVFHVAQPK